MSILVLQKLSLFSCQLLTEIFWSEKTRHLKTGTIYFSLDNLQFIFMAETFFKVMVECPNTDFLTVWPFKSKVSYILETMSLQSLIFMCLPIFPLEANHS